MADHPAYSEPFAAERLRAVAIPGPLGRITPEWAWGGATGRGVRVAVIDSGIEASHPALEGPVQGYVSVVDGPGGLRYDDAPHADDYGHGTACAWIIRRLAPECELYSVKVLGGQLTGRGRVFAAGLRWAIRKQGLEVCNLSLGTTRIEAFGVLHELADLAYFRNVLLVTAANNVPVPSYPSVYSSVISVAAHGERDPGIFYYNPAPPVEFGAPGIDLRVPWRNGEWLTATGNSFAAPHITGLVARILSKHPGLTPFQVKAILHALASNATRAAE